MNPWVQKLTSRKLWLAVALFVSGLIVAFGGKKEVAETVSGCIMQGAAVLGYLLAEGLTDAASAGAETNIYSGKHYEDPEDSEEE